MRFCRILVIFCIKNKKTPKYIRCNFNKQNYALFLFLLIAAFCFFFLLTLGFSYCSCFLRSPMIPSFWHFLLNLLIAFSTFSVSPTLTVDNFFTHFCSKFYNIISQKKYLSSLFTTLKAKINLKSYFIKYIDIFHYSFSMI